MAVDLDEPIKRDHTANVKNHRIRRLAPTSVLFNGIPSKTISFQGDIYTYKSLGDTIKAIAE